MIALMTSSCSFQPKFTIALELLLQQVVGLYGPSGHSADRSHLIKKSFFCFLSVLYASASYVGLPRCSYIRVCGGNEEIDALGAKGNQKHGLEIGGSGAQGQRNNLQYLRPTEQL